VASINGDAYVGAEAAIVPASNIDPEREEIVQGFMAAI